MTFERGDIVAAPYPYVEFPVVRRRPALVIATELAPDQSLIWVLMITSASNHGWPGDVRIETPFEQSGLRSPSVVRTAKVATIEAASSRRIGRLASKELAAVDAILGATLGLTPP